MVSQACCRNKDTRHTTMQTEKAVPAWQYDFIFSWFEAFYMQIYNSVTDLARMLLLTQIVVLTLDTWPPWVELSCDNNPTIPL